jgi:two-component system, LuxR family, sensor kinase FixL
MVVASNVARALACESDRVPARSAGRAEASAAVATDLGLGVLFDRVLDAVVIAHLVTGRIVLWNPAAEKLFGFTADEVFGESIEILMPTAIAPVHRAGLERYLRTGHGLIVDAQGPVEVPARTRAGDEIRVELALSELRDSQGERFALAVIRSAMHRKHLELTNLELDQARMARTEAELDLAGRDELLDTVATVLQSSPSPDEMERLASNVAEFRRLHRGQLCVRVVEADLVDIVHAAFDIIHRRAQGRRLLIHAPPSAPVTCDPARMRQVLDDVLEETIRRTRAGARIDVTLDVVSPHLVKLTVRADAGADARLPGAGIQLGRSLLRRQGGTLSSAISPEGSLEVVMTLPGSLRQPRRKPSRTR